MHQKGCGKVDFKPSHTRPCIIGPLLGRRGKTHRTHEECLCRVPPLCVPLFAMLVHIMRALYKHIYTHRYINTLPLCERLRLHRRAMRRTNNSRAKAAQWPREELKQQKTTTQCLSFSFSEFYIFICTFISSNDGKMRYKSKYTIMDPPRFDAGPVRGG